MYTADKNETTEWHIPYGDIEAIITRDEVYGMFQVHLSRGETPHELDGARWTVLDRCIKDINLAATKRGKTKKEVSA